MPKIGGKAKEHRTQAQRREETRALLLDAAIECLVKEGWSGTSTTLVSETANVSRGAQLHHFPSKADLMSAAVEELFARLVVEFEQRLTELDGPEDELIETALRLLWDVFRGPAFAVVLELNVAARTDEFLAQRMGAAMDTLMWKIETLWSRHFPNILPEDRSMAVMFLVAMMSGLAFNAFSKSPYIQQNKDATFEQFLALAKLIAQLDPSFLAGFTVAERGEK